MKFQNFIQNIFIILIVISSISIASYLWEHIKLPIVNINDLGRGQYIENNYNQKNEILRYLCFVFLPLITFLISMIFLKRIKINEFFSKLRLSEKTLISGNNYLYYLKIIILIFLIFEFLSLEFTFSEIDTFHEGDKLTPAFRNLSDGSLWSESFLVIGLFSDILNTRIFWEIFNHESIGIMRFSIMVYIFLCKIFLLMIAYKISIIANLRLIYKEFFFIALSLIFISLIDYNLERQIGYKNIIYRELPMLIFAYIFIDFLIDKNKKIKSITTLSFLSVFSVMLSLDRGIIFNFVLILFLIFLLINQKYKHLIYLFFSILFSWITTYYLLGDEFNYFVQNSLYIISEINYIQGIIHPTPFSDQFGSSRATKTIIIILLSLITSLYLFSKNENFFSINLKNTLLFFSIISFFGYFYALARSDVIHIRESFGYPIIFVSTFLLFLLFKFFSNRQFIIFNHKEYTFNIAFFLLLVVPIFVIEINPKNITSFYKRATNYLYANDDLFLNDNDIEFIKEAKKYLNDVDCFQNFSNEVALNYLLRKHSCSKYYIVYALGSKKTQNELIELLKNVDTIIAWEDKIKKDKFYNLEANYKLWIVKDYIKKNYNIVYKQGDRIILKKNRL
jgi:hypothetical protein